MPKENTSIIERIRKIISGDKKTKKKKTDREKARDALGGVPGNINMRRLMIDQDIEERGGLSAAESGRRRRR